MVNASISLESDLVPLATPSDMNYNQQPFYTLKDVINEVIWFIVDSSIAVVSNCS